MKRLVLLSLCLLLGGAALFAQGTITLTYGIAGTPYLTQTIGGSVECGGTTGCTFTVIAGALPGGLTLTGQFDGTFEFDAVLSGTPTAAGNSNFTSNFTIQTDSVDVNGAPISGTQAYTLTVYPAPYITPATLSPGTVAIQYTQALVANGGSGLSGYFTWTLLNGTVPPGLTFQGGSDVNPNLATLSGTPTTAGPYTFTIQLGLYDSYYGLVTTNQDFSLTINPILPVTVTGSYPDGAVGVPYSATLTGAGGYGMGIYSFAPGSGTLPPGLTLASTGTLSGTPTAAGTFAFTVQVTNSIIISDFSPPPPVSGTVPLTVTIYPGVSVTPQAAASGAVGVPFTETFAATGGTGSYTWSLAGGTPPPGLTLSSAGTLSGTPTTAGSYSIYVQAASAIPASGSETGAAWFTIAIAATATPTISGKLNGGVVGVPYFASLTGTGGYGAGTYTFSLASGTLPAGLTLSSAGTVSGTPTTAGASTFTIQVTNTYPGTSAPYPPVTGTQVFTVTIYPVLTITLPSTDPGAIGAAYSVTLTATGGAGPSSYTWSLLAGTLPPGLTVSPAGVIGGTPTTAGTYVFTVQVTSQVPAVGPLTASQSYNIAIGTVPSLSIAGTLPGGLVGTAYSGTVTGFGGYTAGAYAFSLASGTLPAGLTLSAGGTLSGTPAAAGSSTFTLQVTNTLSPATAAAPPITATQVFTVVIYPTLGITVQSADSGTVGVTYSQTFTANGGAGTSSYTWSVSAGAAPPGLTLSSAGVLSGTPTASGTFSFSVQVSSQIPNLGTQTATQAYSVVIAAVPALSITGTLTAGSVNAPYSVTLGASGGYANGTYSFALISGTLPAGLTLSTGGVISGTPAGTGTFNFTAQVTSTLNAAVANLQPITATQPFTLVITATALTVSGTLGNATVGMPYTATLTGSGGYGPGTYTFSVVSGTLPEDITLSSIGVFSGTPTTLGTSTFTVEITSTQTTQPITATQSFTITVGVAPAPAVTITGLPSSLTPATQPVLTVNAGTTYPTAITGTITLTFAPASGPDDPNVQFTTGGRTVTFQIPAGSTLGLFGTGGAPGLQTGTVAGTITLTWNLMAAGVDITPAPPPTLVLVVGKMAPVITSATVAAVSGGFNLTIVGYSTTRDMTSATVTFNPASGVTLSNNTTTVPLGPLFTSWYQSAASAQFGSMFSLEIPFAIQNGTNPLASVTVTLTNSVGTSTPATAAF